jgi:hypothetical protein
MRKPSLAEISRLLGFDLGRDELARLPSTGVTFLTPFEPRETRPLGEDDLGQVLLHLCPHATFTSDEIHGYYLELGFINGRGHAEQSRPNAIALAGTLMSIAKKLDAVAETFQARQTGIRDANEVEIVSRLIAILAANPSLGSPERAEELIQSFSKDAETIAHACRITAIDLKHHVGKSGRPQLDWYERFTSLLLTIADRAGIKPRLGKDRITGVRNGWLLEAAQSLQLFLQPDMRPPDAESCGKRLERARKALRQRSGQNPTSEK